MQAGLGVCIQPECSVSCDRFDQIRVVPLDEPWAIRRIVIATLKGRPPGAAATAFIKQLHERPMGPERVRVLRAVPVTAFSEQALQPSGDHAKSA